MLSPFGAWDMPRVVESALTRAREDLERIFRAAVEAVTPAKLVEMALDGALPGGAQVAELLGGARKTFALAAGKAAIGMAAALERRLGERLAETIVVSPRGVQPKKAQESGRPSRRVHLIEAGHPRPDEASVRAGLAARELMARAGPQDLVIVALSGGASALLALPAGGLTLADKTVVADLLMRAGASIAELNAVRRHLSAIKGGQLLRASDGARVLGLVLSDVRGNELATIGSGPTAGDPTTFADAREILKRHALWDRIPEAARRHLERGLAGEIPDTVKPNDLILGLVVNLIIGDNSTALQAALTAARRIGYEADRWRDLYGEARDVGRALAAHLTAVRHGRLCVIAGGEPVVTVIGDGKGGRAQELALALSVELGRLQPGGRIAALAAGTDGNDGPTDAAGAFADPELTARARNAGLDPQAALERNDSYHLLDAIGALFRPGSTGTNVADLFIGLVNY